MFSFKILKFLFIITSGVSHGKVTFEVNPNIVNSSTTQIRGAHRIFNASNVDTKNKLVITLGGTTSLPSDFNKFQELAQQLGFDVIGLDYPNMVSTLACTKEDILDPLCFDKFREELVLGVEKSHLVDVSASQGVHFRIKSLLNWLVKKDSYWIKYLDNEQVNWSKVLLVGHSQGAGHAIYFSKIYPLNRVIVLGGPIDSFGSEPSHWILKPGVTEPKRNFGLLHVKDYLFKKQNQEIIFHTLVKNDKNLIKNNLILSHRPVKDGHNDILTSQFTEEWKTLLLKQ